MEKYVNNGPLFKLLHQSHNPEVNTVDQFVCGRKMAIRKKGNKPVV